MHNLAMHSPISWETLGKRRHRLSSFRQENAADQCELHLAVTYVVRELDGSASTHIARLHRPEFMYHFLYLQSLHTQLTHKQVDLAQRPNWERVITTLQLVLEEALRGTF